MCSQNISLLITPDYVEIHFPDGSVQRCATPKHAIRQLVQTNVDTSASTVEQGAEIWL